MHSHLISRLPGAYEMHYAISTIFIPIYQICIYSQIYNHTTCNSIFLSTITQIISLEPITIPFSMTYTHNYIPYNYVILLTHLIHASAYLFPHNSSHSLQTISIPKHMDVYGPFHTNWDCFYSPKIEQVGCPWAAHSSNIGSYLWNQIPWPFPALYTPNHELMHNLSHKEPKQYVDCHGLSKRALRIFTFRFQVSGLIKRPLMASNQPNHHKKLKSRVKQVG